MNNYKSFFQCGILGTPSEILQDCRYYPQSRAIMLGCAEMGLPDVLSECINAFVIQNFGGKMPRLPEPDAFGTVASLQFGLLDMNVRHILICGHEKCRFVTSAENGTPRPATSNLRLNAELHILQQAKNVVGHPWFKYEWERRKLKIHLWMLNDLNGHVSAYMHEIGKFSPLGS